MWIFLMPGRLRAFLRRFTCGVWSVWRCGQTLGCTQESFLHLLWISVVLHRSWYMLAVGPPISLTMPLKPGILGRSATSFRRLSSERDCTMRPWWSVIAQNEQPPKQPRVEATENRIMSAAGMRRL